jgi:histidine triad (HIT) family protein
MQENNKKGDCLFCKIIAGEIPSYNIYEDGEITAFLDISPVNNGHTLVLPKKHVENLLEMDDETISSVFIKVRDISKAVMKSMNADGFNIEINNYKAAGQLVDHAHIHIVPRFESDGLRHWPGKKLAEQEMREIAEKIRAALK